MVLNLKRSLWCKKEKRGYVWWPRGAIVKFENKN